jgi:hypothetical protein
MPGMTAATHAVNGAGRCSVACARFLPTSYLLPNAAALVGVTLRLRCGGRRLGNAAVTGRGLPCRTPLRGLADQTNTTERGIDGFHRQFGAMVRPRQISGLTPGRAPFSPESPRRC